SGCTKALRGAPCSIGPEITPPPAPKASQIGLFSNPRVIRDHHDPATARTGANTLLMVFSKACSDRARDPLRLYLKRGACTGSGCREYFGSFLLRNGDEGVYNLRVELSSCTFQKPTDRFGVRETFL